MTFYKSFASQFCCRFCTAVGLRTQIKNSSKWSKSFAKSRKLARFKSQEISLATKSVLILRMIIWVFGWSTPVMVGALIGRRQTSQSVTNPKSQQQWPHRLRRITNASNMTLERWTKWIFLAVVAVLTLFALVDVSLSIRCPPPRPLCDTQTHSNCKFRYFIAARRAGQIQSN